MPIFIFGIDLPGKESFSKLDISSIQQKLSQENSGEVFVAVSDNSFEVFVASEKRDVFEDQFWKLFRREFGPSFDKLKADCFRLDGLAAIRHFFKRIIGMTDSGELDQSAQDIRRYFLSARERNSIGPLFNRLYQRGLWLAEKVRIELHAHKNAITPETVVAGLAQKIFGDLNEHSALIISKSLRCETFVQQLCGKNLGQMLLLDLRTGNLQEMCEEYRGKMVAEDQLSQVLASVDLVLSFDNEYLSPSLISRAMNRRKNAPLLWATLSEENGSQGHKPDFSNFYNIYYYDQADLENIVASNLKEHQKITGLVNQLIDKEVADFLNWVHSNEQYRFGNIIGKSRAMQEILELVARIAQTDISVLVDGESGTGKELVARAIHEHSSRAQKPFIIVNCGAVPETLLESELFGHVRGAFTGATSNKKGLFEAANHGTIFLDEIGETSPATQVKLLRFLQDGEIKPIGSNQTVHLDVRVIAATNRDLAQMVHDGSFRQDLYYRLNVIQLTIPPLRERREDILPLAEYFIRKCAKKINKTVYGLDGDAQKTLYNYNWLGNIRELENAMERAVALSSGNVLIKLDLPPAVINHHQAKSGNHQAANLTLKELERRHISAALEEHDWNYDLVTKILGIGRTTLWRKMKEYKISNMEGRKESNPDSQFYEKRSFSDAPGTRS